MKLNIKLTSGLKFSTEFTGETVLECKQHLTDEHSCAIPSQQRLVYKGRILDDSKKLIDDYEIVEGSTLFLVSMKEKKAAPAAPTATATCDVPVATASATSPPPMVVPPPPDMSHLIEQMTQMQTQGSQTASPNSRNVSANNNDNSAATAGAADPFASLQGNPMLQSLMNENPDFLTNMMQAQMESNPALRQLMESNPVVREALSDPAALRQMLQTMSNPELRAQQQRHHDLALANIENMPGGFNMLRNLYETVQAPMEEAAIGDSATNDSTSNNNTTSDATAGASNQAMPNPWGSSRSARSSTTSASTNARNSSAPNPFAGGANPFADAANPFGAMANPFSAGGNPIGTGQQPSREQQEAAITMLESNPQLQQMLSSSIRQNPGMIRQLMQHANPMAANMMNNMSDEQLGRMMEMVTNPAAMRGLMQMQEQMQNNGGMPPNPMDMLSLMGGGAASPFGGVPSSSVPNPWATSSSSQPPAIRYARQLEQMRNMGFEDEAAALSALERAGGNLNRAVDLLLEGDEDN